MTGDGEEGRAAGARGLPAPALRGTRPRARAGALDAALAALGALRWRRARARPALRATERELRRSEQRLRDFAEASSDWFWETDAEHRYVWFSENVTKVTGVPREWHYGKSRIELAGADPADPVWRAHLDRLDAHLPFRDFEFRRHGPDGTRLIRSSGVPIFDEGGRFAGYRGTGTDITALRAASEAARGARDRLALAMEAVSDIVALFDADERLVACNRRYRELHRDAPELMRPGTPFETIVRSALGRGLLGEGETDPEAWVTRRLARFRSPGESFDLPASGDRWLRCRDHRLPDGGTLVIGLDVTERKRAERRLAESERALATLMSNLPGMVYRSRAEPGRVLEFASEGSVGLLGRSPGDLLEPVPTSLDALVHPGDRAAVAAELDLARRRATPFELTYRLRDREGTVRWVSDRGRGVHDARGELTGWEGFISDVTATQRMAREMAYRAEHDEVTDLLNRRGFRARLEQACERAREAGVPHGLCYLDLDQFKVVNDAAGHAAGDLLLRQVATLLGSRLREDDVLARLGGDEFGLLLPGRSLEETRSLAQAVLDDLREFRFVWNGRPFEVGVSIGAVAITADSADLDGLLARADIACYAAKDLGRNRVHVYEPTDTELARRQSELQVAAALREALEKDRLRLWCQPIVALGDGPAARRYEILVRMVDERGALISPGVFIPAAERYGLMGSIDRWVIATALRYFHTHFGAGGDARIAINLSGASLADADLAAFVRRELDSSGVSPARVGFEITETAAVANADQAVRFMNGMRELGCSFALDDFGSGLCSFSYLKRFPVDYLKIDGSFVRGIAEDPIDRAMVGAINQIGHVLGIRTVGEFAENEAIVRTLRAIGVDYAQGYGVCRPFPVEEAGRDRARGRAAAPCEPA